MVKRSTILSSARWVLVILAALVLGPVCALPMQSLRDADGGHAVSMLVSSSLPAGLLAGLAALAGAVLVGAVGSYFFTAGLGFAASGLVMGWCAWHTTTLDEVVRRTRDAQSLPALALEGLLAVGFAVALALMIQLITERRVARAGSTPADTAPSTGPLGWFVRSEHRDAKPAGAIVASAVAGAAVAALVAWIVAASDFKGQAVFAALSAGVASGVVVQMTARSMHCSPTPALACLALAPLAVVGPLLAGGDGVAMRVFAGDVFPLARVLSLDWTCGALLGVPVGLSWAGAMIDQRAEEEASQTA